MLAKVFKVFIISIVCSGSVQASNFIKCVSEDFGRVFIISSMLKKDLFAPGNHRDKTAGFALIRMKHQGKIRTQELNHYKVTEKSDNLKIKAKSKFQSNFIANSIWTKTIKRIPDFKVNLKLDLESQDGSGKISLLEYNSSGEYLRKHHEVYCKKY